MSVVVCASCDMSQLADGRLSLERPLPIGSAGPVESLASFVPVLFHFASLAVCHLLRRRGRCGAAGTATSMFQNCPEPQSSAKFPKGDGGRNSASRSEQIFREREEEEEKANSRRASEREPPARLSQGRKMVPESRGRRKVARAERC